MPMDGQVRGEIDELRDRISQLRVSAAYQSLRDANPIEELTSQLVDAQDRLDASIRKFVFEAISYEAQDELKTLSPPTKEQEAGGSAWNPDEFTPRIISACAVEPEITLEDARVIVSEWEPWQVEELFSAAYGVCNTRATMRPKSLTVSDVTDNSG